MQNPVLLLHGALGSKMQLQPIANLLKETHQVYTMNFDGHGGKPILNPYTMERFAQNVLAFMDEHDIPKVDIFGYSMGGYVALVLAKNHPEKVGKIITLGTKLDWSEEVAMKETKMLVPEIIEEKLPAFAARLNALHQPEDWKKVMLNTAEMMLGLGTGKRLKETDFESIHHEVHLCLGEKDNMVTQIETEHIKDVLPNGSFELLDNIPHPIEKVNIQLITDRISSFLTHFRNSFE